LPGQSLHLLHAGVCVFLRVGHWVSDIGLDVSLTLCTLPHLMFKSVCSGVHDVTVYFVRTWGEYKLISLTYIRLLVGLDAYVIVDATDDQRSSDIVHIYRHALLITEMA
jgi:hypothetical protein